MRRAGYRAEVEDEIFGDVTTPTARPPIAPARIPMQISTSVLSTSVVLLRPHIISS
jgi:hypothetical protein